MPFGLDLKSLILGALFVWFILPWVMGLMNRGGGKSQAA